MQHGREYVLPCGVYSRYPELPALRVRGLDCRHSSIFEKTQNSGGKEEERLPGLTKSYTPTLTLDHFRPDLPL